ncbi:MAG: alpha/beta fold hydrolase [Planctomycetia bacterium]|nr:alpha/beta fold hydrolase [Planctomycetia bacterium]
MLRHRFINTAIVVLFRVFAVAQACVSNQLAAQAPPSNGAKPAHQRLDYYLDANGAEQPVKTPADWERRRVQILAGMEAVMGPLPAEVHTKRPLDVQVLATTDQAGIPRQTISFAARNGERVTAYLYIPKDIQPGERRAAILALHPTGEIGKAIVAGDGKANREYGFELAKRGYIVIAPDYVSFGDQKAHDFAKDDYVSGTMKGIVDHMRSVDLLQSRADVDPERIGVIGHSLGGHNALFVAAFDRRIKAIVSSCGWCPFHDYYEGKKLANWAQQRYMPFVVEKYNAAPDAMPFDFYELAAAMAPRPFYSNAPLRDSNFDYRGVKKATVEARAIYELLGSPMALQSRYPDCVHDFPNPQRREAYTFLDAALGHKPTTSMPVPIAGTRTLFKFTSTADKSEQPCYITIPPATTTDKVPLLVSLHSWSGDLEQLAPELESEAFARGWITIAPNFRGVNQTPEACASKLAQQDILDAVEWAASHHNVDRNRIYLTGQSGGGHMTMQMVGNHPEIWAAASAWVGIGDLAAWHKLHADDKYGAMLRKCCGGAPGDSTEIDAEYRARSPNTKLANGRNVPLDIAAGIYDGHAGSVPVRHSLEAFNVVARANLQAPQRSAAEAAMKREGPIDEATIENLSAAPWRLNAPTVTGEQLDSTYDRTIYFRRTSDLCRVTLFEGGHERLDAAAIAWLAAHAKK